MAKNVAKAGAAKGGSCKGFSGPGERCHPAVSKWHSHRTPFDNRRGQEKGKGWELQGGFSVPRRKMPSGTFEAPCKHHLATDVSRKGQSVEAGEA